MRRTCSTYGGKQTCLQGSSGDQLEDRGVDRKIILKLILRSGMENMDWIDMAQDRDR